MSRESNASRFFTALGVTLAAGMTLLVAAELPGMRRYMRILRRAKRVGAFRSSAIPGARGASSAPGPRRAGDLEPVDREHVRHPMAGGEGKSARRVSAARVEERAKRLTTQASPGARSSQ
jgi:hypothetical protein